MARFRVNGRSVEVDAAPASRLTRVLRDHLGLTGTKVGCDAGDCGACTVLLDGEQVCACLVSLGQVAGRSVATVESLAENGRPSRLQQAFLAHGAAQCGICTPGMLMAASTLLGRPRPPTEPEVLDALGGVLCRCTGYRKIVRAVLAATNDNSSASILDPSESAASGTASLPRIRHLPPDAGAAGPNADAVTCRGTTPRGETSGVPAPAPETGDAAGHRPVRAVLDALDAGTTTRNDGATRYMGRRIPSVDGIGKVTGGAVFGADEAPNGALHLRVVRSPYPHARFTLGDCTALHAQYPGLARVLTAADVPGVNGFGIYPDVKDQPVLAAGIARYRGEAVAALVGDDDTLDWLTDDRIPIEWEPLPALCDPRDAVGPGAPSVQPGHPDNVLTSGRVHAGEVPPPGSDGLLEACGEFETPFVEHAYIEPEAGYARRIEDDRIEVSACTQTPYMDRDEVANVLGIAPVRVRVRPSACGGGFGGKLDQSVQPLVALAAWVLDAPVRCVYTRTESMAATTKRHPSRMRARAVADRDGRLLAYEFDGDFDTGAYASWGPTVAGRVPVHCMGPYRMPNVRADSRAILTNSPPSGAFRGFGVPQAAIAHESLVDELAIALKLDPLEFRHRNALRAGDRTATGQVLEASVGLVACLDALRPRWTALRGEAEAFNASGAARHRRRGAGVACMWYGCGNTSMSNPSSMRVTLSRDGRVLFRNGAQDIGQGSSTIMLQIMAEALGLPMERIDMVVSDTDLTEDAGKSSASRQTFVSGRAAQMAGADLRAKMLALANAGADSAIRLEGEELCITGGERRRARRRARTSAGHRWRRGATASSWKDGGTSIRPPPRSTRTARGSPTRRTDSLRRWRVWRSTWSSAR